MTSVPVTDAFDESEAMDQLEVELPPAQMEWLEEMAEKQGVSRTRSASRRHGTNARVRGFSFGTGVLGRREAALLL